MERFKVELFKLEIVETAICLFFDVFVRGFCGPEEFFRRYFGSFVGSEVQSVKWCIPDSSVLTDKEQPFIMISIFGRVSIWSFIFHFQTQKCLTVKMHVVEDVVNMQIILISKNSLMTFGTPESMESQGIPDCQSYLLSR